VCDVDDAASRLIGRQVTLTGHFDGPVKVEAVRQLSGGHELRVRLASGQLEETVVSTPELEALLSTLDEAPAGSTPADPELTRLLIESARIRLAYAYDRQFAVSLSGIRTLPHQIEAVYMKMLPQPRLRFLLADDPGAGKTIMAGLLLKEMKLREAVERVLILVPAPLTIQWQDELQRYFGEVFFPANAATDRDQLVDPWQRESQVIASLDYAKQDNVRERVWQQRWDLVIIDEAHKCSAYTRSRSDRAPEAEKTKRYQLAEKLSAQADHMLLLTATPHHGDDDRFGHFVRLIDPDLFPEPHRLADQAREVRRDILRLGPECPWALRRLKEDLRDLEGRRLFPDRHAQTVTFELNSDEFGLYKAVTGYINLYLPQSSGRRKHSIALTRTVFQRRLASSTQAIHESLRRRFKKQKDLLDELESLPPAQRARRLEALRGRLTDDERDDDDLDDAETDQLVDEFTAAEEIDRLRDEVAALGDLVNQARHVRDQAGDSKLAALKDCLAKAEFDELKDGRGKLLLFTEHRDTLRHVREHLDRWGYSTCEIHGGMGPRERKQAEEDFRTRAQICVATEAAGEGINLQFCHLMINYDLPWNPTRLEQRLGRIHRIGQERDCYVFNFVANQSQDGQPIIEGRILERLLEKLDQMREVLGHERVFDVIGEVLSLNEINLPEMLRDAAYEPGRLDDYLDQIDRIDPEKLRQYEQVTGIALARSHVNFQSFERANLEAEEHRLMPEYVARYFLSAANLIGLRVEQRADGLWRIERVPQDLRSDRLESARRAKPDPSYRKVTFNKADLEQDQHVDAVLLGPGHPLYAAVDEKANQRLGQVRGRTAVFVDPSAAEAYHLHFMEMEIRGNSRRSGDTAALHAELVAVKEQSGEFSVMAPDVLHDLVPHPSPPAHLPAADTAKATDFLRSSYQLSACDHCRDERRQFAKVCEDYLRSSFEMRIRVAQDRVMKLRGRIAKGESEAQLALRDAENDLADLERTKKERLDGLSRLGIARTGPVAHVASVVVLPPGSDTLPLTPADIVDIETEVAAMNIAMEHERQRGWEPTDVGRQKIGFDLRSLSPADPATGRREVRRIEVKGRAKGAPIRMTTNEWLKARQLASTYWLYVVWDPNEPGAKPVIVKDPANALDHAARVHPTLGCCELPANAILSIQRPSVEEEQR
jgi:superfamily II DNA or RNA helicase